MEASGQPAHRNGSAHVSPHPDIPGQWISAIEDGVEQHYLRISRVGVPSDHPNGDGGGGGDLHYVHNQGTASSTWTIPHGLGKRPVITVYRSDGMRLEVEEDFPSLDVAVLTFSGPTSGTAYLN